MFRVAILSDLHIEGAKYDLEFAQADVLILAGDIASSHGQARAPYRKFRERANEFYGKENVLEIEGNHTGYGGIITDFENTQICEVRGDVVLIGATLWSGEGSEYAYQCLNDSRIPGFSWEWMRERHRLDLDFIDKCLRKHSDKKCVVFTHHLPSIQCVHEKWLVEGTKGINLGFYTDLDWFIEEHNPAYWICGHTHDGFHKFHTNGKTQLICNPRGYRNGFSKRFENDQFNPEKVIEIE